MPLGVTEEGRPIRGDSAKGATSPDPFGGTLPKGAGLRLRR